jgi:hypothetical protein
MGILRKIGRVCWRAVVRYGLAKSGLPASLYPGGELKR